MASRELGHFDDEEAAARAYDTVSARVERPSLNFPAADGATAAVKVGHGDGASHIQGLELAQGCL